MEHHWDLLDGMREDLRWLVCSCPYECPAELVMNLFLEAACSSQRVDEVEAVFLVRAALDAMVARRIKVLAAKYKTQTGKTLPHVAAGVPPYWSPRTLAGRRLARGPAPALALAAGIREGRRRRLRLRHGNVRPAGQARGPHRDGRDR